MKSLIINNHSKHVDGLVRLFPNPEIIQKEDFKSSIDVHGYDLVVFSGGYGVPTVLRHPEFYSEEIEFIKKSDIPMLGICLGSELITKAFGGELKELSAEHRGIVKLKIVDPFLEGIIGANSFEASEGHEIGIAKMPEGFVETAHSNHGIEIMKHKTRPIIAIQFHPEISANEALMKWVTETLSRK